VNNKDDLILDKMTEQTNNNESSNEELSPTSYNAEAVAAEGTPLIEKRVLPERVALKELQTKTMAEVVAFCQEVGWRVNPALKKLELVHYVIGWLSNQGVMIEVEGIVDIIDSNHGMLRYTYNNLAFTPSDLYIGLMLIKKYSLRSGQKIKGFLKNPRRRGTALELTEMTHIEDVEAELWQPCEFFEKLTAAFPDQRLILESVKSSEAYSDSARMIDLLSPLGKGQRGLICASPRSGKTVLMKDIAKAIVRNHPEVHLIVLLLDERPEEVTDIEEGILGCDVYSSTFDESSYRHTQLAELVLERAKRLVELGKDVMILLDSLTRLSRGYNALSGGKGRIMSGGMDSKAMAKPKRFFGSARKVEEGGSLTIVATALVETESRMDELIFEEFKGTGNMEIMLDRELAELRVYPAIHLQKSGTRRDDLLFHPDEFKRVTALRRQLVQMPMIEGVESLLKNIKRTSNNAEILLTGLK
jgi:transcription termination factor Rho